MRGWNDWYHCMGHTYGTWLPGDPKSFRTRHHREHIIGDYRHPPPPGMYEARHEKSKQLMKRDPVFLDVVQRRRAVEEFVASLLRHNIPVAIGSVDAIHFHFLSRFADHDPRKWIGIAKRESSHYCKVAALAHEGGLWAVRCKCKPIADAEHCGWSKGYIRRHERFGAAVWAEGDPLPDLWDFYPSDLLIE